MMQRIVYLLKIQNRMILIQETFYQLHLLQNTYCLKNDRDYHHICKHIAKTSRTNADTNASTNTPKHILLNHLIRQKYNIDNARRSIFKHRK